MATSTPFTETPSRQQQITAERWDSMKGIITRLYLDEDQTLAQVRSILQREHDIAPTPKQLKDRLKKWGFQKNVTRSEREFIISKLQSRLKAEKDTVFYVRKKPFDLAKIERYVNRDQSPDSLTGVKDSLPDTPPDIQYRTPSPPVDTATRPPSPVMHDSITHNTIPSRSLDSRLSNSSAPVSQISYHTNAGNTVENTMIATACNPQLTLKRLELSSREGSPSMQSQLSRLQHDQSATRAIENARSKANCIGSVILLYWQGDENRDMLILQLNKLATVFKEGFGYDTEIWAIPDQNCQFEVHFKILEFAQKGHKYTLQIVYYAGPGKLNDHFRLVWISSQKANDNSYKTVKWSSIQSILEETESDVLIILECCASLTISPESRGGMECLAASAFEFENRSNEFSSVFLDELMALVSKSRPFIIAQLYSNMLQNLQKRWHVRSALPVTPVHIRNTEGDNVVSTIRLYPRRDLQHPMEQQVGMTTSKISVSLAPTQSWMPSVTIPFGSHLMGTPQAFALPRFPPSDSAYGTTSSALDTTSHPRKKNFDQIDQIGEQLVEMESSTPVRDTSDPPTTELNLTHKPSIPQKRKRGNAPSLPRMYQCTSCSNEFTTPADWKRHEESHFPQKIWVCRLNEAGGEKPCSRQNHPFSRKDHLVQHLRMVHGDIPPASNSWYQTVLSDWKKQCGFCGARFDGWGERCNHLGMHFQEGQRIASNWREDWPES